MSEHELTIQIVVMPPDTGSYLGECTCGWMCRRTRERDLKREYRKHSADAAKPPPWESASSNENNSDEV